MSISCIFTRHNLVFLQCTSSTLSLKVKAGLIKLSISISLIKGKVFKIFLMIYIDFGDLIEISSLIQYRTHCHCNVHTTSSKRYGRCIDVETTMCVSREKKLGTALYHDPKFQIIIKRIHIWNLSMSLFSNKKSLPARLVIIQNLK